LKIKYLPALFLACLTVMLLTLCFKAGSIKIDNSVLSLLPKLEESKVSDDVIDTYLEKLDKLAVFVIDTDSFETAYDFYNGLKENQHIDKVIGYFDDKYQKSLNEFIFNHKTALINDSIRARLQSGTYPKWVLGKVFSGFSGTSTKELENDPLLLTRAIVSSFSKDSSYIVEKNFLKVQKDGKSYYFFTAITKDDGFDMKSSKDFCNSIDTLINSITAKDKDTKFYKRGTVFYSNDASIKASDDLTVLGSITVFGVFLLIYGIYRSFIPVVLAILSVGAGLMAGFFGVIVFFNAINLVIVGMCLSVIGVVCDYTIYYMTLRMAASSDETPKMTMKKMSAPLLYAALTDAIAYFIIVVSPITPLKELALFCMMAITFACIFVILIEPLICKGLKPKKLPFTGVFNLYLSFIHKKATKFVIVALILAFNAYGLSLYKVNDDPAALQQMDPNLKAQDDFIAKVSNQSSTQKYLVIEKKNKRDLLETNDRLKGILDNLIKDKAIVSYKALPLNSYKVQCNDFYLIEKVTEQSNQNLKSYGFNLNDDTYNHDLVELDDFLESPLGLAYRSLYVKTADFYGLSVILDGVENTKALKDAIKDLPHVEYLDRREDFTNVFSYFRELVNLVIATFMIVILVISMIRLKPKKGLLAGIFSLLNVTTAMSALFIAGFTLNLFSELSLVLVLGIGINYTIFFANSKDLKHTSLVAITTALCTTLLTIGVLIFSSVAAIQGFALTLSVGIICSFVLATLLPEFTHD